MTKHFFPLQTDFQGLSPAISRRRRTARRGVAQLELILVLPVVVFLLVMIFYVVASCKQKHNLDAYCRNKAWEERYQPKSQPQNPQSPVKDVNRFVSSIPNGKITKVMGSDIRTGLFFDHWDQKVHTKHLVLSQTWDHDYVSLNRHPIVFDFNMIRDLLVNFGKDALADLTKEYIEDALKKLMKELAIKIIPDEITDFVRGVEDTLRLVDSLEDYAYDFIQELLEDIDEIVNEALAIIDFDIDGLMEGVDSLYNDVEKEIKAIQTKIDELKDLISMHQWPNESLYADHSGVVILVSQNSQTPDQIDEIKNKIYKLQLILDELKTLQPLIKDVKQKVSSVFEGIKELGDIKKVILDAAQKAKKEVNTIKGQFDTLITTMKTNPLDFQKHQQNFSNLIESACECVRAMTETIEDVLARVMAIKDKIIDLRNDIDNLRERFGKLKKDIENL